MNQTAAALCATCRGSGWIVTKDENVESAAPCPDCRTLERVKSRLEKAEIPPRYMDRGFDVYSIHHKLQEQALKRAIEFVAEFPKVVRGLLFVGPCGVGKTHLSVAILKTLIQEKSITAKFVDEAELLRRLHYSYGPDAPETEREVLVPLMHVDLLVWDDLGTGRPTEWVAETIRTILNHRYTYRKHTILTTNWPLKAAGEPAFGSSRLVDQTLAERIGQRLLSRIMEMCEVVEIDGPDSRTVIHKAGLDFQKTRTARTELTVPAGLLRCPQCDSAKVEARDYSKSRKAGRDTYVEISCFCKKCQEHFAARFFPATARLEYPSV